VYRCCLDIDPDGDGSCWATDEVMKKPNTSVAFPPVSRHYQRHLTARRPIAFSGVIRQSDHRSGRISA